MRVLVTLLMMNTTQAEPINESHHPSQHEHTTEGAKKMPLPTGPVLITGISGMLGSYLARYLVENGVKPIYGLVRYRSDLQNLKGILQDINLVYGDVTDAARMREIARSTKPRYIYHYAAQAINIIGKESPYLTLDVNVLGTLNVLEAVVEAHLTNDTRVFIAGSSAEYGLTEQTWGGPLPEHAPTLPGTIYGTSKLAAENIGRDYFIHHNMKVITVRIFNHFAPGGPPLLSLQDFCRQIALIELGLQSVLRHGFLGARRDMTDVRDSIKVHAAVLVAGTPGEVYNIGSGDLWSTKEVLDLIIAEAKVPIKTEEDDSRWRKFDEKNLRADITKIRNLLSWTPNPDLHHTVVDILNYWRRQVRLLYTTDDWDVKMTSSEKTEKCIPSS